MPPLARLEPFLLHESSMVRDRVGFHFYESWSAEEELALLVLEVAFGTAALLIDPRFRERRYRSLFPPGWRPSTV